MKIAANQASRLDAQEPRFGSEAHQSGDRRDIADLGARSARLADHVLCQWKDAAGVPTAEFVPDSTRSCELSLRSIALAAGPCQVPSQPMHVGPPPNIALMRNSCQPVEATACCRQIASLDLQPRSLDNPFGLQNLITSF